MVTETTRNELRWLTRMNLAYGACGIFLFATLGPISGWWSFLVGWIVAIVNFELFKRIGAMLLAFFDGEKLTPAFYALVVGKFVFLGGLLIVFFNADWIQGVPFVSGVLTLLIAGLGLGTKELVYARRT